jgi:hypothetical protein
MADNDDNGYKMDYVSIETSSDVTIFNNSQYKIAKFANL